MSTTVHCCSPTRKELQSPRRRSSSHHGRSPDHRMILTRDASPVRNNSSRRARSPQKEKLYDRARSSIDMGSRNSRKEKVLELTRSPRRRESKSPPKVKPRCHSRSPVHPHSRSPIRTDDSRSPSPLTKRLSHAEANRGSERLVDRETAKGYSRENDKGRQKERSDERDILGDRRTIREKVDRGSSRLPRRDSSNSPEERAHRSRYGSRSPSTTASTLARDNRGSERLVDRETAKGYSRENDKRRQKERSDDRDIPGDRRTIREKVDRGSSRLPRHDSSNSPEERTHRSRYGSRSPSTTARTLARDEERSSREPGLNRAGTEESVLRMNATQEALEAKEKEKPSFELSGKLAEETNRVRGVTLLFTEPLDARKPDTRWRLYVFKAGEVLNDPLYVHRQSCYLFGRERRVADIPTDHPSCSKQHAVLQYRIMEKEQPDGLMKKQVRPYLLDLGSTNGTFINDNRVEPQRYYELFEKDTIKFGNSSREYVLLHENSVQ